MVTECPICGEMALETKRGDFRMPLPENIPGDEVVIGNAEWRECGSCKEQILPSTLIQQLNDKRYELLGLLTPREIEDVRKEAALTQKEIADILGIGEKTYTRWESGKSIQNKSSDNLIRIFKEHASVLFEAEASRTAENSESKVAEYIKSIDSIKGQNKLAIAAHGLETDFDENNHADKADGIRSLLRNKLLEDKT